MSNEHSDSGIRAILRAEAMHLKPFEKQVVSTGKIFAELAFAILPMSVIVGSIFHNLLHGKKKT